MGKGLCFTGHRPEKLLLNTDNSQLEMLTHALKCEIDIAIFQGFDTFYTGMARGIDLIAAELVIAAREKHPQIKLMAAVPHKHQAARWRASTRERYEHILKQCNAVLVLSPNYHAGCLQERNIFMVENSERVVAVYNGSAGGTQNTIEYAESLGKEIVVLNAD